MGGVADHMPRRQQVSVMTNTTALLLHVVVPQTVSVSQDVRMRQPQAITVPAPPCLCLLAHDPHHAFQTWQLSCAAFAAHEHTSCALRVCMTSSTGLTHTSTARFKVLSEQRQHTLMPPSGDFWRPV
eukprot:1150171-Pelagomonas_calceolata.AAC.5